MLISRALSVAAIFILALANVASAQPAINYPTFLFSSPFQSNGSGQGVTFSSLLLNNGSNQVGSIFVKAPQDVTQSFDSQFTFYFSPTSPNPGNAGIAYVIEGDPRGTTALGSGGQQIGYGDGQALNNQAIQNSLALVYSSYTDQFQLFANTNNANLNVQTAAFATQSGSEALYNTFYPQVNLNYTAPDLTDPNGDVTVLLNGNSIGLDNVPLPASLASLVGAGTGYFGFSGVTDSGPANVAVNSLFAGPAPEPASLSIIGVLSGLALARRKIYSPRH